MNFIKVTALLITSIVVVSCIFPPENSEEVMPETQKTSQDERTSCINEYDRCRSVEDFIAYSSVFTSMREQCQQASILEAQEYAEKGYKNATGNVQFGPNSFEQIVIIPGQNWADVLQGDGFVAKDEQIHLENTNGAMVPAGAVCLFNTKRFSVENFTIRYD